MLNSISKFKSFSKFLAVDRRSSLTCYNKYDNLRMESINLTHKKQNEIQIQKLDCKFSQKGENYQAELVTLVNRSG